MNTAQLQCFLTVADTLNFARAAQQLHITQPAVTQQIHALEKELGVQLFHRTTHSVRLTDEGMVFLGDARQITLISNRAKKRFSLQSSRPIEPLFIGCMHMKSMDLLTAPLSRIRQDHPHLHPILQLVPFQHIYRLLDEGSLDVVAEFQGQADSGFIYKELLRIPMVCACPADHPFALQSQVSIEELKSEPLVLPVPSMIPASVRQQQEALLSERSPMELHLCDSMDAISVLVASGYGVTILPEILLSNYPGLVQIPLQNSEPVSFGLYYKTLKGRPLLKSFVNCARDVLGGNPSKLKTK